MPEVGVNPESPKTVQLAGCIIRNEAGEVLLLHRNTPKRTQWEIPGGKVEPGEHPRNTAVRELGEELGVAVEVGKELGGRTFEEGGRKMDYTWFQATVTEGTPSPVEDDFDDIGYFSLEQLGKMRDEVSANTRNFLDAHNEGEIQFEEE